MAKNVWDITFEDGPHTVEVKRSFMGKRTILVDGREAPQGKKKNFMEPSNEIPVRVGSHDCLISLKSGLMGTRYEFTADADPTPTVVAPKWAWLFVGLCLLLPVVALGGAIPAVLGVAGSTMCYNIAKQEERSTATRVALCVLTTAACWGAFFLLITLMIQAK